MSQSENEPLSGYEVNHISAGGEGVNCKVKYSGRLDR